ncbi:MAG: long-chain fatty acid--CoA ligase [Deltaproteobacteria bacterium]|nr:long-chain fatty acid--CoA ligase [Deltaproteobacteria bacterium]
MENTIVRMVDARVELYGERTVMERKVEGTWQPVSWKDLSRAYREVARGLACLGFESGDRVAILSENRPEWVFADLGILAIGGVDVPLYWTLTPAQLEYILLDCSAGAIFVSSVEYLDKILKIRSGLPELRMIVCFDPVPEDRLGDDVITFDDLLARGCEAIPELWESLGKSIAEGEADDLVTIIYTSGTTGEPKGAMLTNNNFLSNVRQILEVIQIKNTDTCLSFLPLSHVFERLAYYLFLYTGGKIAYAESIDQLIPNMGEVRPTILVSVPRVYEKAYGRILDRVRESSLLKRIIFVTSLSIGQEVSRRLQQGKDLSGWLRFRQRFADRLVFSRLRQTFGGRIRLMISGGAPLSKRIAEFFHAAGLIILEGYGLTETSPVISANDLERLRFGSVGHPLPGVEVRIADDGEIQVRGPNVMKGYFNRPSDTAESIDQDGWFSTGDLGHIDHDGFLVITGRKKNIIVTAGGKNVAPSLIENALSADKFISQAFVFGDRRQYISALIVPDWDRMENYAREHKIKFSSRRELCDNSEIKELLQGRIDSAQVDLSRVEQVKRFKIMEREFSQDKGEVTPTMKLRRKVITSRFWKDLESLYDD